ncbi:MAG TPA: hypothetical protein VHF58_09380 [Solirubrobacterales bacterium]|nr:hypothetical protein [Solirubrobacterales bacterium]
MAEPTTEYRTCAVCGRTLLRGERGSPYVDPAGAEETVCPLCKGRAEAAGWVPAALAGAVTQPEPARRRPALNNLRERLAKRVGAHPRPAEAQEEEPRPRTALDVFNASQEVRKVAGLRRSLGEPRVSVRDDAGGGRVITVAWDLSWYQWSVQGENVKQVAKGNEISELPIADRDWNAVAAEDGTLSDA